jgi:DNA modification methylase
MLDVEKIKNTIICGDCLEIMKQMPDKCVDLILADYPFNCQDGRKNYEEFIYETAKEFLRISKDVSNLIIINSPAKIFTTSKFFHDWKLINEISLLRRGSLRPAYHFGFQHNSLLVLNRGGIKEKWNGTKKNHDKNFLTDVIQYQNGYRGKGGVWHPQAIPLDFTKKFINILSNEKDLILDPFLGSGTTAVAAKQLKRNFIGIEISPDYCKIAEQRLRQEILL